MRWTNGFQCPKCQNEEYWITNNNLIHCKKCCGTQTSITGGTLFHGTRKPLLLWFHIVYWVVAQKTGASASNLADFMGFGSYETTWTWLQKLRRPMVRPNRDKLSGIVEVNETYIGGQEGGNAKKGRGAETKTLVVVATECIGKQIGRVRFECVSDTTSANFMAFIDSNIEKGSTVVTDRWRGYMPLTGSEDYRHVVKTILGSSQQAHELLPHVHMVDSLVKRWINGTHHGKISPKHLTYYLDEFAFRFNRKMSTYKGKLFYRLVQQAVDTPPITYNEITKPA